MNSEEIMLDQNLQNDLNSIIQSFNLSNQETDQYVSALSELYKGYIAEHILLANKYNIENYSFECVLSQPKFLEDRGSKETKVHLRTHYDPLTTIPTEYKKELSKLTQSLGFKAGSLYKEAELMLFVNQVQSRASKGMRFRKFLTLHVLKEMGDQCLSYSVGEVRLRKHFKTEKNMLRYSELQKNKMMLGIIASAIESTKRDVYLWKMVSIEIKYKVLTNLVSKINRTEFKQ
ncbi:hypothetical protein [Photobacterium damselae]|uniref:hypothetical protein n=1 Tax=Photobacterium damselae TaxID=38293 RepID=UPI0040696170